MHMCVFVRTQSLLCEVRAVTVLHSLLEDSIFKLVTQEEVEAGGKMGIDRCGANPSLVCVLRLVRASAEAWSC